MTRAVLASHRLNRTGTRCSDCQRRVKDIERRQITCRHRAILIKSLPKAVHARYG